jgi:hypothetical protein
MEEDVKHTSSLERVLYLFAMFTSFLGALLLLTQEFGGYRYNYPTTKFVEGHIGDPYYQYSVPASDTVTFSVTQDPYSAPVIILLALGLFFCSYVAFRGLSSKIEITRRMITNGAIVAFIVFIITNIGAYFVVSNRGDNFTWLGFGYLGGTGGSLLVMIFFTIILIKTRRF